MLSKAATQSIPFEWSQENKTVVDDETILLRLLLFEVGMGEGSESAPGQLKGLPKLPKSKAQRPPLTGKSGTRVANYWTRGPVRPARDQGRVSTSTVSSDRLSELSGPA